MERIALFTPAACLSGVTAGPNQAAMEGIALFTLAACPSLPEPPGRVGADEFRRPA